MDTEQELYIIFILYDLKMEINNFSYKIRNPEYEEQLKTMIWHLIYYIKITKS